MDPSHDCDDVEAHFLAAGSEGAGLLTAVLIVTVEAPHFVAKTTDEPPVISLHTTNMCSHIVKEEDFPDLLRKENPATCDEVGCTVPTNILRIRRLPI
jgi:hypothetical protein